MEIVSDFHDKSQGLMAVNRRRNAVQLIERNHLRLKSEDTYTPLSDRNVAKKRYITPRILKTAT